MTLKTVFAALGVALCGFVVKAEAPATATWTGCGNRSVLADPLNWVCRDAGGNVLEQTVPDADTTDVTVAGDTNFMFPAGVAPIWKSISFADTVTLAADCDWRGLGSNFTLAGTINLNGHRLWLSDFPASGSGTIVSRDEDDYIECSYLESSGTQYIDTKYQHDGSTVVDFKMAPYNMSADWIACFGARVKANQLENFCNWITKADGRYYHCTDVKKMHHVCSEELPEIRPFTSYDVHLAKNGACTINGKQVDTGTGGGCSLNDYLFCINEKGVPGYHVSMRLSICQIRSGANLVRDYVPVIRCSDWQAGLFDRVEGKFYENAGTGRFSAGGAKVADRTLSELYIDVPEGKTVRNETTRVRGLVKVIKTGDGVYRPICDQQDYVGGTDVRAGTLRGNDDAESDIGVRYGLQEAEIRVGTDANLEISGQHGLYRYHLVLDGGEVGNTVANVRGRYFAQLANVTLTSNSSLNVKKDMGLAAHSFIPASIDLGGYELKTTINPTVDRYFSLYNGVLTNGTFNLATGGWCVIDQTGLEARTVDFIVKCALEVNVPSHVRGYSAQCPADYNKGTAPLNVYGIFEPVTDYFYGCTLQNGATLDLSKKTGTWSTKGAFTSGLNTVGFADHAMVTIELGERKPKNGELIVSWDEAPKNLSTLSFVRPKGCPGSFRTTDKGIEFRIGMVLLVR